MTREEIVSELFRMREEDYAKMQARILPTIAPDRIIGVRTPALRAFAKRLRQDRDAESFLSCVPHFYFDESQLHAFVIAMEQDFEKCITAVEAFLPFVDNWATCDQLLPKVFRKEPEKLLPRIRIWIRSDQTYTVRYAIGLLMQHFLGDNFDPKYADMVAAVRSEDYYINMMIAWYFATALAKQYESVLPYLEEKRLSDWVHRKTIRKSVESYRIPEAHKAYLKTL